MGIADSRLLVDVLTGLFALGVAIHFFPSITRTSWSLERTTLLVFLLGASLAVGSRPRSVGDGVEYVTMARQLADLKPPALTSAEVADANQFARAKWGVRNALNVEHLLVGRDGRRDLAHFWLYSLLAAPFVRGLAETTIELVWAFTAVNVMFLVGAFYFVAKRSSAAAAALVLLGPLVWWIDKPHTEILIVSCLSVAVAVCRHSPGLALMALGLATAQNPALAPALAAFVALTLAPNPRNRRIWLWVIAAGSIAAIRPLY